MCDFEPRANSLKKTASKSIYCAFVEPRWDHPADFIVPPKLYGSRAQKIRRLLDRLVQNVPSLGVYGNGTADLAVCGTILIECNGQQGHIPIEMTIPVWFPMEPPICKIPRAKEESDTVLNSGHPNLDVLGHINLFYLSKWHENHSYLEGVVNAIKSAFSIHPPLYWSATAVETKTAEQYDTPSARLYEFTSKIIRNLVFGTQNLQLDPPDDTSPSVYSSSNPLKMPETPPIHLTRDHSNISIHSVEGISMREIQCPISQSTFLEYLKVTANCSHVICPTCFQDYLEIQIGDLNKYPIKCYEPKCGKPYDPQDIEDALATKENGAALIKQYAQFTVKKSLGDALSKCPHLNCDLDFMLEIHLKKCRRANCYSCSGDICLKCGYTWDTCKRAKQRDIDEKKMRRKRNLDRTKSRLAQENRRSQAIFHDNTSDVFGECPKCKAKIERIDSCNHMTHHGCPKSKSGSTEFCIYCNVELKAQKGGLLGGSLVELTGVVHFPGIRGRYGPCRNAQST